MRVEFAFAVDLPDKTTAEELEAHVGAAERALTVDDAGEPVEGVNIVARGFKTLDQTYRVVGTTRGKPDDRIEVEVPAQSAEEAEAKALEQNDKLAIAAVIDLGAHTPKQPDKGEPA